MQKNKYAIMQTCSFTGIHLDDKIQKAKKREMFFAFCRRPTTKRLQKGFCNRAKSVSTTKCKKTKVSQCAETGAETRR